MAERQKFMVVLSTPSEDPAQFHSRAQRIAALKRISQRAKEWILRRLSEFRNEDPAIQVTPRDDTIFPVIFVTTTDSVIRQLEADPNVRMVLVAPDFQVTG
jgi:hypothetical protein